MEKEIESRMSAEEQYLTMNRQAELLLEDVDYDITMLANISALIYNSLENLNWAGFYLMKDGVLKLGPFQGAVACTVIPVGKGVCGAAVAEERTQRIEDVHQFPGHIACDSRSNSEIVIPIHKKGEIYGVLDIDSPEFGRFSEADQEGLEKTVFLLEKVLDACCE